VVFPGLREAEIASASQSSIETWDSIATITLVSVIEEEFAVTMDYEVLPDLNSFEPMLAWVRAQAKAA
jgi:acyl carrier protein